MKQVTEFLFGKVSFKKQLDFCFGKGNYEHQSKTKIPFSCRILSMGSRCNIVATNTKKNVSKCGLNGRRANQSNTLF